MYKLGTSQLELLMQRAVRGKSEFTHHTGIDYCRRLVHRNYQYRTAFVINSHILHVEPTVPPVKQTLPTTN